MTVSITIAGVTDTLKPEHAKYERAFTDAENAMKEVLDVINASDFETMDGWKLKKENEVDRIYSRRFAIGKIFTVRATFDAPCEQLFTDYWDKYEESAYRNKNTSLAQKIATFTPNVELIHHAVKDSGIVKGRDFVMTRIHRRINNEIIVAVRSYDTDEIKPHKKKIRSRILLGGGRFRIHPQDSQKSIIDFLICLDYSSIDLTKSVLESTISKHILQDTEWIRKDIEKHRRGESNK